MLIYCFDHTLGAFGLGDSNDIVREIVCDYLQFQWYRFTEFIENDFDNYIDQLKNWEHGVENFEIIANFIAFQSKYSSI